MHRFEAGGPRRGASNWSESGVCFDAPAAASAKRQDAGCLARAGCLAQLSAQARRRRGRRHTSYRSQSSLSKMRAVAWIPSGVAVLPIATCAVSSSPSSSATSFQSSRSSGVSGSFSIDPLSHRAITTALSRGVTALHPHGNPEASASQRRDRRVGAATVSLRHHEEQSSRRRPNQPSSSNQRRRENAATRQKEQRPAHHPRVGETAPSGHEQPRPREHECGCRGALHERPGIRHDEGNGSSARRCISRRAMGGASNVGEAGDRCARKTIAPGRSSQEVL